MTQKDVTVITPIRNVPIQYFKRHLKHIAQFNSPYVVVDDQSDEKLSKEYQQLIEEYQNAGYDFQYFLSKERVYLAGGVRRATELARTKYVMRVDADDLLLKFPPIEKIENENLDAYFDETFQTGKYFYFYKRGGNLHALIFKRKVLIELYSNWKIQGALQNYIPEDTYILAKFLWSERYSYEVLPYRKNEGFYQWIKRSNSASYDLYRINTTVRKRKLAILGTLCVFEKIERLQTECEEIRSNIKKIFQGGK